MSEPMTTFHHVALSVTDLEQSIAWYKNIFDLDVLSRQTIPHNGWHLAFVGNSDFIIELLEIPGANPLPEGRSHPDTDNVTLGCKHFCVAVDNNVEFIKRMKEIGVPVVFEPPGMPSYCGFINDPTGNVIEVFDKSFDVSTVNN